MIARFTIRGVNGEELAHGQLPADWLKPGTRSEAQLEWRPELDGRTFVIHPSLPLTVSVAVIE